MTATATATATATVTGPATAARCVARTRVQLLVVVAVSALLWAGAVLCAVLSVEALAGGWSRERMASGWGWNIALAVAMLTLCVVLWRARFVVSARRVALWMEERAPSLQYALITASDPFATGDVDLLESAIDVSSIDVLVRPAVLKPVIHAAVGLSLMASLLVGALALASSRSHGVVHDTHDNAGMNAPMPNRLLNLSVRVTAPAYAGGSVQTIKDPSGVTALAGSDITVRGSNRANGIGVRVADRVVHVDGRNSWQATLMMPRSAAMISLTDRQYDRVIALIPIADQPPAVTMTQPTRDTVWRRVPSGAISFVARATDDIGLAVGHLEYTVTTGSGEIFKSRTRSFGVSRLGGARTAELRGAIPLPELGLAEGAILSVRAVVSDNNTLNGPGTSTSDTRTFRVARADEYDSLAVEAAPPPPMERSLLTERMLITSAESLFRKRPSLAPKEYVSSSGRIGLDQADLRKKVYGILYQQEEAGGSRGVEGDDEELDPQLVLNRDMKEAYDAMWDAERSLNVGEIKVAIPFMTRALHALDRARLADRLYIRGRAPRIVVNVDKVRLTAKEKGVGNVVAGARSRADTAALRLNRSLDDALALARTDPSHFMDALIRLRVEGAAVDSTFAAALGDAVDAFHAGKDMTSALMRARKSLLGAPLSGRAGLPWSGSWSGPR